MKLSISLKLSFIKNRLTAKAQKQWESYFNLTHYQEKIPEDASLTGRKMLAFIEEALKKTPAKEHPNYPKDFDSDSTPTP